MSDPFRAANPLDLELAVQGLTGPVTTDELRDAAVRRGASAAVVQTLDRLPRRSWPSPSAAIAHATDGWQQGPSDR